MQISKAYWLKVELYIVWYSQEKKRYYGSEVRKEAIKMSNLTRSVAIGTISLLLWEIFKVAYHHFIYLHKLF